MTTEAVALFVLALIVILPVVVDVWRRMSNGGLDKLKSIVPTPLEGPAVVEEIKPMTVVTGRQEKRWRFKMKAATLINLIVGSIFGGLFLQYNEIISVQIILFTVTVPLFLYLAWVVLPREEKKDVTEDKETKENDHGKAYESTNGSLP